MNSALILFIAATLPAAALAATRDPGVNHRQGHQQARIHQGVKSGELTRSEV